MWFIISRATPSRWLKPPFLMVEFSQPYPTIHPASPPVAPQTAWRKGNAIHTFVVTYRTCAGILGFLTVHGLIVASSIPMAVILFWQLWHIWNSSLMHTCIWQVRMWTCLKHRFNIFATHGGLFLNQFCEVQSKRVPNTWREKCCRFEILWTLRRTSKPCLGVQLYVAISIYVYNIYINKYIHICISYHIIYIYHIYKYISIYIYIIYYILYDCRSYTYPNLWRFESDGYTKFSSWTAPKCRISFRFTRNNPGPPSCSYHWLSVSIQLCPMWLGGSSPLSKTIPLWPFPPFIGGFSKSIMVTADPHDSSSTHGNFRISTADHLFLGLKIVTVPSNIWG